MSNDQIPVVIPTEIVNDKEVILLSWLHETGGKISKGDVLAIIETSKTNMDVLAPIDGFITHDCKPGDEVSVGAIIGYVSKNVSHAIEILPPSCSSNPVPPHTDFELESTPVQFSKKSRELITQNNIDPSLFFNLPFVKESDVIAFLKKSDQKKLDTPFLVPESTLSGKKPTKTKRTEIENLANAKNASIRSVVSSVLVYPYVSSMENYQRDIRLPTLIFEISRLLQHFDDFNSYYHDGLIYQHSAINIAFAIDAGFGLKTVTVANADKKNFIEIEERVIILLNRYMENTLLPEDFQQASFTISDLSSQDVFYFDPLLSHRQSGILGVATTFNIPGSEMGLNTLILSFDHQVLSGKRASEFLAMLKKRLLASIEEYVLNKKDSSYCIGCTKCYRSFQDLEVLRAKLLSYYVTPYKLSPICTICLLNGWE